jgi:hypothetical protein
LPPCLDPGATGVQVTVGTAAAVSPLYAGFVADSVAGLYQVTVPLPASFTPAVPTAGGPIAIQVSVNGVSSPAGVMMYVK